MTTALIYSDRYIDHDTGAGHPERPERLRAIATHLRQTGHWDRMTPLTFEAADLTWIGRLHERAYLDRLKHACDHSVPFIDVPDSAICRESYDIARLAVGGTLAAIDAVIAGQAHNAFCAVRPPGHHAEADRSMGFCLFNNIAIAAEYLIGHHGLERVAILDFDVHHGNGTQHIFEERDDVLFISLHEHPDYLYPGTGFAEETGQGKGEGFTLNLPLMPHAGDDEYKQAFTERVLPAIADYKPQMLLISAGFDAAEHDPLAHQMVTNPGFRWFAQRLRDSAEHHCDGRMVALLEGGYDLTTLSQGAEQLVDVLLQ
jgi:acetoin utilization deacetylase AcuC-like enzyme